MPSRRLTVLVAAVAAAALAAAGCGSGSGPTPAASRPASSSVGKPIPLRPPARQRRLPHRRRAHPGSTIGSARRVDAGGTQLEVTIRRLVDPLRGSGASLPARTHAVGVLVEVRNGGPGIYDSSATGDFSIVPSVGSASPAFAPSGSCQTQLRDFDNYITPGEVRDGCIVFAVRDGARVRAVRFSPHAQAAGRATWTVGG